MHVATWIRRAGMGRATWTHCTDCCACNVWMTGTQHWRQRQLYSILIKSRKPCTSGKIPISFAGSISSAFLSTSRPDGQQSDNVPMRSVPMSFEMIIYLLLLLYFLLFPLFRSKRRRRRKKSEQQKQKRCCSLGLLLCALSQFTLSVYDFTTKAASNPSSSCRSSVASSVGIETERWKKKLIKFCICVQSLRLGITDASPLGRPSVGRAWGSRRTQWRTEWMRARAKIPSHLFNRLKWLCVQRLMLPIALYIQG